MKHDPDEKPMNSHAWRQDILDKLRARRQLAITYAGSCRRCYAEGVQEAIDIIANAEVPSFAPVVPPAELLQVREEAIATILQCLNTLFDLKMTLEKELPAPAGAHSDHPDLTQLDDLRRRNRTDTEKQMAVQRYRDFVLNSTEQDAPIAKPTASRSFKVGDTVRFEMGEDGFPRWNHNEDRGGPGKWVTATVVEVNDLAFLVSWRGYGWVWPQPGQPDARYGEPGYLELVEAVDNDQ